MDSRHGIVDLDPVTRVRRVLEADEHGILHAQSMQDVTERVKLNKALQNEARGGWGEGSRIASIPLVVYEDLIQKRIISRSGAVLDEKAFLAWLNDPDNRAFRTRLGKV